MLCELQNLFFRLCETVYCTACSILCVKKWLLVRQVWIQQQRESRASWNFSSMTTQILIECRKIPFSRIQVVTSQKCGSGRCANLQIPSFFGPLLESTDEPFFKSLKLYYHSVSELFQPCQWVGLNFTLIMRWLLTRISVLCCVTQPVCVASL